MSIYQKLKSQLLSQENASPRVVEATPEAGVGRVVDDKIVDATLQSHAEVLQVATESELINDEVEVLVAEHQGLDKVHQAVEDTLAEGGLNPQAASVVDAAMEAMAIRIGIRPTVPSSESFGSQSDRMAMTRLSIEAGFKETLKKIWEAIKNLFIKAKDAVLKFFGFKKKTAEDFKVRFEAIAKKAGETKGTAKADAKGPETNLFHDGTVQNSASGISSFLGKQAEFGKKLNAFTAGIVKLNGAVSADKIDDAKIGEAMSASDTVLSKKAVSSIKELTVDGVTDVFATEPLFGGKVVYAGFNAEAKMVSGTHVIPGDKVETELNKNSADVKKIAESFVEALKDATKADDAAKAIEDFFTKSVEFLNKAEKAAESAPEANAAAERGKNSKARKAAKKAAAAQAQSLGEPAKSASPGTALMVIDTAPSADVSPEEAKETATYAKEAIEEARQYVQKVYLGAESAWLGGLKGTCEYLEKSLEAFEEKSDS